MIDYLKLTMQPEVAWGLVGAIGLLGESQVFFWWLILGDAQSDT